VKRTLLGRLAMVASVVAGGVMLAPAAASADETLNIVGTLDCDRFTSEFSVLWDVSQAGGTAADIV
jgi:hypothetical protein